MMEETNNKETTKTRSKGKRRQAKGGAYKRNSARKDYKCKTETNLSDNPRNDANWYTSGPNGSIPFNVPFSDRLGTEVDLTPKGNQISGFTMSGTRSAFPGVAVIPVGPTIGQATAKVDPINIAVYKLHAALRYGQAYSHTYDATALAYHLIMADSAMMLMEFWRRIYGMLRYYSADNGYMPEYILRAIGVDASTFLGSNYDAVREYINHMADALSIVKVPKTWTYFRRHQYLMSTIYADSQTTKAQFYAFTPAYLYRYTITSTSAYLEPVPFFDLQTPWTFDTLKSFTNEIIDSLIGEDDVSIIAADILRLYGAEGTYKWEHIDANYSVVPMYDTNVLLQIHNARFIPGVFGALADSERANFRITQNTSTGAITFIPHYNVVGTLSSNVGHVGNGFSALIDVAGFNPTPEMVAEASRLLFSSALTYHPASGSTNPSLDVTPYNVASEICFEPFAWYFTPSGAFSYLGRGSQSVSNLSVWDKFNFAPLYTIPTIVNDDSVENPRIIGLIDNYAVADSTLISRMNLNALLSMMQVPILEEVKVNVGK
nr:putative capsid [Marmot picobirnavirus]